MSQTSGRHDREDLLTRVTAFFSTRGTPAYVVGGAVRDRLASPAEPGESTSRDVDITVSVRVMDLIDDLAAETSASVVVMDAERGHIRLVDGRKNESGASETGESDPESDPEIRDLPWIDLTGHNGDIETDLSRRDFTVNAMAVPLDYWVALGAGVPDPGSVIDPYAGAGDVRRRLIRETRPGNIVADPVRMFRAVRFATQLDFELDPDTATVVKDNGHLIDGVTGERIREEFFALMASSRPAAGIRDLDRLGLLDRLLPELVLGRDFEQPREHYYGVMEHQIQALDFATRLVNPRLRESDPVLKNVPWGSEFDEYLQEIAGNGQTRATLLKTVALLHDIGKPETKSVEPPTLDRPNGRIRFLGHDELGSRMASDFLVRLRCSRRTIAHISRMIQTHMRPGQMSSGDDRPSDRAIFRYFRDVTPVAIDTILLNLCDFLAARGPLLKGTEFERYSGMLGDTLSRGLEPQPERTTRANRDLLLDGHQVQDRFGLQSGPEIGRLLDALRDAESSGVVSTTAEAYELLARLQGRAASRLGSP
jgi:poly(A) polymerase